MKRVRAAEAVGRPHAHLRLCFMGRLSNMTSQSSQQTLTFRPPKELIL